MFAGKSYRVDVCTAFYSLLAYLASAVHYGMIRIGFLTRPLYLSNGIPKPYNILQSIWCARIFRSMLSLLVRSPFRKSMLRRINFDIPIPSATGCVVVICHTPWERLLVEWCIENRFGLVITSGSWTTKRKMIQRKARGVGELRAIVRFLQRNGRIIIAFDTFNNLSDCPVTFLSNYLNASVTPARFAKAANVMLISAIPVLSNGVINFIHGPSVVPQDVKSEPHTTTKELIAFLEKEVIWNPSIMPSYVK